MTSRPTVRPQISVLNQQQMSQVIKQGTPVILGILPAYFDMRGMENFHDSMTYVLNLTVDEWRQQGSPRADDRLRTHTRDLIDTLGAPENHADLIDRGEAFIRSALG
jgi:trimethylamine:corrinoid methyltransferase-like protein